MRTVQIAALAGLFACASGCQTLIPVGHLCDGGPCSDGGGTRQDGGLPGADSGADAGDGGSDGGDAGGPVDGGGNDAGRLPDGGYSLSPDAVCSIDNWCWQNPLPWGNDFVGIFALAPDDIWASGVAGAMIHWDGQSWRGATRTSNALPYQHAVWGASPADVWVAGQSVGTTLHGVISHWDGGQWSAPAVLDPTLSSADSVWGTSSTDVWAVAAGGLFQWDGQQWSLNVPANTYVYDVWGQAGAGVWIVGQQGAMWHWDGANWSQLSVPSSDNLFCIWGASPTDLWVGTQNGSILHSVNGTWTTVTNAAGRVTSVRGSGPSDVWAFASANSDTYFWHWDGTSMTPVDMSTQSAEKFAFPTSSDGWAVGLWGAMWQWNGQAWKALSFPTAPLLSLGGTSPVDMWAVGAGATALHWDGSAWSPAPVPSAPSVTFRSVAAAGPGDVWIAGTAGTLLHGGPSGFAQAPGLSLPSMDGVWAQSPTDVWAVGAAGTVMHLDGGSWASVGDAGWPNLHGVLGVPSQGTLVVGDNSFRAWESFGTWSVVSDSMPACSLHNIAQRTNGDVVVEGVGCGLTWNGQQWTWVTGTTGVTSAAWEDWEVSGQAVIDPQGNFPEVDTPHALHAIWGSAGHLWAAGDNGTILHWH